MPNGNAAIGSVLPRENRKLEFVPCRGLADRMPEALAGTDAAPRAGARGSLISPNAVPLRADPTSVAPEPLRKSRRPKVGPFSFLPLIINPARSRNVVRKSSYGGARGLHGPRLNLKLLFYFGE